jgi:glycosyltransferase involved in cell wall biosynthesis
MTTPTRVRFLAHAMRHYDVFHLNFGSTILPGWGLPIALDELPLLRRAGKIVIATFQGDDARPPDRSPTVHVADAHKIERRQRNGRRRMLSYAHRVFYLNPDLREWLPGAQFCPYASFDPRTARRVPPRPEGELTVVHAPSQRAAKGTDVVLAAIEELRSRGIRVRLDLVEGVTRSEALARYAQADVAIDQLYIGWYGGFAVEAMSLGKPVLCYIKEADNPFRVGLPIVRTTAATLQDDLLALVHDRTRLTAIGAASRAFVERHHDPRAIARLVLAGLVDVPRAA